MTEKKSSIRILKSSSYICSFKANAALFEALTEFAKKINVRIFNVDNADEYLELLGQVKHCVGCFIHSDELSKEVITKFDQLLNTQTCPVVFTTNLELNREHYHFTSSQIEIEKIFKNSLDKLMPKRLNELTVFAANNVLNFLIGNTDLKYSELKNLENFHCDFILSCQVQAPNIFGYCFLKVNTQNIDKVLAQEYVESEFKLMDFTKEMVNQFWGIICQNIRKVGIFPQIGLPSAYDMNGNAGIAKTYIPAIYVKDDKNIFAFEVGFASLDHTIPFDLTNIEFNIDTGSEEAELELL